MADTNKQDKRPRYTIQKRRRGSSVPTLVVVILLVLALVMGGFGGFAIARGADPSRKELEALRVRCNNMENILTTIGFTVGEDDPDTWVLGDTEEDEEDALAAITSDDVEDTADDDESALWEDDGVLSGLLSDDGDDVVVAEFDGGNVMSSEVIPLYNEELSSMIFQGYDADEVSGAVLQSVVSDLVGEKLIALEASRLGLDQLSEADEAQISAAAETEYEENLNFAMSVVADEDMTEDEIADAALDYLQAQNGITEESLLADQRAAFILQKVRDHVVQEQGVSVTDDEIQARYDQLLEEQKEDFAEVPDNFFYSHLYGTVPVVYNPEGFRAVRDILIPFDSVEDGDEAAELMDEQAALDVTTDGARYEEVSQQLNALFAPLEATAQEALDKLNGGAAFTDLMDEYGCSDPLSVEPLRSQGYYINADSYINSQEYVEGSMMLETVGDISTPLRSTEGLHLVQYLGEVTPGEVPLENVREAVSADVLADKEEEAFNDHVASLLEGANVKYYTERLQ